MPPFKLEVIKYNPNNKRAPKMLYCKKEYIQKVKITDWNLSLECEPIDTNPYNPKCFRLHNSHYDRLGNQNVANPISETHDFLRSGLVKSAQFVTDPHKRLVNVYTYTYCADCTDQRLNPCPQICLEYTTTMRESYQPPYPQEIKKLIIPVVGNQNKHMAAKQECKFLDDNFRSFTKTLQKTKGFRHVSFNPCNEITNEMTC